MEGTVQLELNVMCKCGVCESVYVTGLKLGAFCDKRNVYGFKIT